MRSAYLLLLAAVLKTSTGSPVTAGTADAWGECGKNTGVQKQCPTGYRCDLVNHIYEQCVPESYPPPPSKRDAGMDVNSTPEEPTADLNKRQTTITPVTGAFIEHPKECYHRRKIQTLQGSYPDQFNMLLLAFEDLQKQPEDSDVSWFGIAGIHGAPFIPWQQPANGNYNQGMGYCVHGGPTFATWHRPYTLLMEQTLQSRARTVAARFTGSRAAAYRTAAYQLRLPYYDWSDPTTQSSIPAVFTQATISITRPGTNGVPVSSTVPNPLFSYRFQSVDTLQRYFSGNYARWMATTRNPRSNSDPTPQNSVASTMMQNGFTTRRSQTYQLFSMTSFNSMAGQLEGIHNSIHTIIGGSNPQGHMSVTTAAAFDPIFWFHHCNVDRLTAMYQSIYPDNKLTPSRGIATFARIVPGTLGSNDDMFTPLYPFRLSTSQTSWWTSNEIKSVGTIWKYKYGYDEIPCSFYNQTITNQERSDFTRARANALYSGSAGGAKRRSAAPIANPEPKANALAYPEPKIVPHQPGYTPGYGQEVVVRNEYGIRCMIDHSELPGSWTAHILLTTQPCGQYSYNPGEYFMSKDRIAGFSSFGTPYQRKQSMPYAQEYPITENLVARNVQISNVSAVEKWLKDNLKICFTSGDDPVAEIPASSLKSWMVGVYMQTAKYPRRLKDGSTLPSYGDKKYLPKVTKGMPGGITTKKQMDFPIMLDGHVEDLLGDRDTY